MLYYSAFLFKISTPHKKCLYIYTWFLYRIHQNYTLYFVLTIRFIK